MHAGGTGTLTVTGTTFSRNTSLGAGGAGADVYIFAFGSPGGIGTGTANFGGNTLFQNNQALSTGSGAGLLDESIPTTVANTTFTNNAANNRGGAVYVAGRRDWILGQMRGLGGPAYLDELENPTEPPKAGARARLEARPAGRPR